MLAGVGLINLADGCFVQLVWALLSLSKGEEALVLRGGALDKIDGLEADLRCAVQVAYKRGATEWARLNYPQWIDWLEQSSGD